MATESDILFERIGKRMQANLIGSDLTHIVCGPISSGGFGSIRKNMQFFNRVIEVLQGHGFPIWSQMPFEDDLQEAKAVWFREHPGETYCHPILDVCYGPVFELRRFTTAHFIPGRDPGPGHSTGTAWEYEKLGSLGVDRRDVDTFIIASVAGELFPGEFPW